MESKNYVMALYKPKQLGDESKIVEILRKQIPVLMKYELIRDNSTFMIQSENGIVMQTWEWVDEKAMRVAHEHPAIREIWGELESVCQFTSMSELAE